MPFAQLHSQCYPIISLTIRALRRILECNSISCIFLLYLEVILPIFSIFRRFSTITGCYFHHCASYPHPVLAKFYGQPKLLEKILIQILCKPSFSPGRGWYGVLSLYTLSCLPGLSLKPKSGPRDFHFFFAL